ncbi:hypothetical protein D9757_000432 [Collybiopsis confluens]|uniref:Uncharacterized protein n=1 Tax=Collybiopsis confluens TaxID=2823264 RepID=A0A8H5I4R5_9AGAR|nr:hypothetical protein D9757_000432 [Collybiopsis confluens]
MEVRVTNALQRRTLSGEGIVSGLDAFFNFCLCVCLEVDYERSSITLAFYMDPVSHMKERPSRSSKTPFSGMLQSSKKPTPSRKRRAGDAGKSTGWGSTEGSEWGNTAGGAEGWGNTTEGWGSATGGWGHGPEEIPTVDWIAWRSTEVIGANWSDRNMGWGAIEPESESEGESSGSPIKMKSVTKGHRLWKPSDTTAASVQASQQSSASSSGEPAWKAWKQEAERLSRSSSTASPVPASSRSAVIPASTQRSPAPPDTHLRYHSSIFQESERFSIHNGQFNALGRDMHTSNSTITSHDRSTLIINYNNCTFSGVTKGL